MRPGRLYRFVGPPHRERDNGLMFVFAVELDQRRVITTTVTASVFRTKHRRWELAVTIIRRCDWDEVER